MSTSAQTPAEIVAHLESLLTDPLGTHVDEFLAHLDHPAAEVREVAVRGLWDATDLNHLDNLFRMAELDASEEVRSTALSVLGRVIFEGLAQQDAEESGEDEEPEWLCTPEQVERVRTFLSDVLYDEKQPDLLRRRALESLAFDPGPEEVSLIEGWARDRKNKDHRISAIFAMGRAGLEQWEKPLLKTLDDKDPDFQREAIRAVGEMGLESAVPRLRRFVEGKDRDFRLEAIMSLGEIGGDDAQDLLEELLEDESLAEDEELMALVEEALLNIEMLQEEQGDWEDEEDDEDDDGDDDEDDEDEEEDEDERVN